VRVRGRRIVGAALGVAAFAAFPPGCSLGEGQGSVTGTLDVPLCWSGLFDLKPDFFAAVPSPNTGTPSGSGALEIRIQNGGDFEAFSDGLSILVDDAGQVRGDPDPNGNMRPSLLGKTLIVSLPAGVTPPGVPLKANPTPDIVHATLYLQKTCRTQNVALYAMDAVSLEPDGTCNRPDGGEPPLACQTTAAMGSDGGALTAADAGVAASFPPDSGTAPDSGTLPDASAAAMDGGEAGTASEAGGVPTTGTSTITFTSLFDGNPNEENAQKRLTNATFHFYLADPREVCPGGLGPPPRCRGELTGYFKFYFQRGRPAQPFL
jgi:hypothetical protein